MPSLRWFGLAVVLVGGVGCGAKEKTSDGAGGSGGQGVGGAGAVGGAGMPGAVGGTAGSGAAGSAGKSSAGAGGAASGGSAGSGGGGMPSGVTLDPQPECDSPALACNGTCLQPGASANGCTFLLETQSLASMTASGGDLYFAGSFPFNIEGETPPSGIYRLDGGTLELTALDTEGTYLASRLVVSGDTLYYLIAGQTGATPGKVGVVPTSGGTASELVGNLDKVHDLFVIGERAYVAASFKASTELESLFWVPLAGGEPQATALTGAAWARANQTELVVSWNGNINSAPLPDGTPKTEVMDDFELPLNAYWIDDEFVYWNKDGTIKRSPLSELGATEESGEIVQTLPAGMAIVTDIGPELILKASATDATGVYVMPVSGGTPELAAVVGSGAVLSTLDTDYVYFQSGFGVLRAER
jgi:hypothetical protein